MAQFHRLTDGASRGLDKYGSGQFGASRGNRTHQGLDIVARPGEHILSPIDGEVIRESFPYPTDPRYRGILIQGTGEWDGYEVKIFYTQGLFCGQVKAGQWVGTAQNLEDKYPGITNHVHLEVRFLGMVLSPLEMYQMCF